MVGIFYHSFDFYCSFDFSGQYVAINGAASMWARNFTIGQKKNEHLVNTDSNFCTSFANRDPLVYFKAGHF